MTEPTTVPTTSVSHRPTAGRVRAECDFFSRRTTPRRLEWDDHG